MSQTHKKYAVSVGIALAGILALVIFWKLLVGLNVINLNQLAPKSYTRSSSSHSIIWVFLIPVIATSVLLLGLSWKRD